MRFRAARVTRARCKINCGKSAGLMAQIGVNKEPDSLGLGVNQAQRAGRTCGIDGGINRLGACRSIGQTEGADAPGCPFHRVGDMAPLFGVAGPDHAFELIHQLCGLIDKKSENLRIERGIAAGIAGQMGHIDRT